MSNALEQIAFPGFEELAGQKILDDLERTRARYLKDVRDVMRFLAEDAGQVTPDDARAAFEAMNPPPPEQLSRNFLACVFREPGWEAVGQYKSRTPGSHGNRLNIYVWRGRA